MLFCQIFYSSIEKKYHGFLKNINNNNNNEKYVFDH